jgi:membrane-associated phospholipid phosphatase
MSMSRRKLIAGAAAGATTSFAAAAASKPATVRVNQYQIDQRDDLGIGEKEEHPAQPPPREERAEAVPARRPRFDPVIFWSDAVLDLCSIDHTVDTQDSRAFGAVAAQRAFGLVHATIADAVSSAYPAAYQGLYLRQAYRSHFPDAFVGGAAAAILGHIYNAPAHSQYLDVKRLRFMEGREPEAYRAWLDGLAFGRNEAFTSKWSARQIADSIAMRPTGYIVPIRRGHTVDPFNADQGFYGAGFGKLSPLTPNFGDLASHGPGDPPGETAEEYLNDFREVLDIGAYRDNEPTPDQVSSGLFWAFCGARLVGPPARLYNQLIRTIAAADGVGSVELARILALCHVAMADAGIVCWAAKYHYKLWRPVVALRLNGADWRPFGGPRTNPIEFSVAATQDGRDRYGRNQRLPYHLAAFTPNFPSYPSGHATFAGAGFGVLRRIRAEYVHRDPDRIDPNLRFVSEEVNGVSTDNFYNRPRPFVPRTFSSLSQMIEDVSRSRIHLGVHFNYDCKYGARSGEHIARTVYDNAYRRGSNPHVSEGLGVTKS